MRSPIGGSLPVALKSCVPSPCVKFDFSFTSHTDLFCRLLVATNGLLISSELSSIHLVGSLVRDTLKLSFLQNVTEYVGGCPSDTSDTIECLRQVSFDILLAASQNITSTYSYQMQPRADGVVLPDVRISQLCYKLHAELEFMQRLLSTFFLLGSSTRTSRSFWAIQLVSFKFFFCFFSMLSTDIPNR